MSSPRPRAFKQGPPRENLAPASHHYAYRIEMTDGELLTGTLVDVTPDGVATVRLGDGALVERPCDRMVRLTSLEAGGPAGGSGPVPEHT